MTTYRMLIPGPVDVDDAVLKVLGSPQIPHYGPEWAAIYADVVTDLKHLFGTGHFLRSVAPKMHNSTKHIFLTLFCRKRLTLKIVSFIGFFYCGAPKMWRDMPTLPFLA